MTIARNEHSNKGPTRIVSLFTIYTCIVWKDSIVQFKASAHSFKRFTTRPFQKISFSLYAPITSEECHA